MSQNVNLRSPEFLKKLQTRDNQAVSLVVKKYTSHLTNASFGLGFNESDSVELVQSVWVTFFEKVPTFEGRSHIRTYIFGILYNKAKELKRDRVKHTSKDPFEEVLEDKFDTNGNWIKAPLEPDKFIESVQTMEMINHCMETLPLQQKMTFYLREVVGNSTEEICNILDVSSTNFRVLLYRAKNKLRSCIERKTIASTQEGTE